MQINRKQFFLIFFIVVGLGSWFGSVVYKHCCAEKGPIYEFKADRDTAAILNLFDQNWYWLIANEGSSPAFYLKYRTPNENPLYFGKLRIKVLREHDELLGFVAYFLEHPPKEWRLLFLAVDEKCRGKGYGTALAEYAMNDMIAAGAEKICLWTRLANPAQRIYKKLGFIESYYTEGGYIFYEYYV